MAQRVEPSQLSAEFEPELEIERQQLLRRRFLWYTGTVIVISGLFSFLPSVLGIALGSSFFNWGRLLLTAAVLFCYVAAFIYVLSKQHTRWPLIEMCLGLIVISGILNLLAGRTALGQIEMAVKSSQSAAATSKKAAPPREPNSAPSERSAESATPAEPNANDPRVAGIDPPISKAAPADADDEAGTVVSAPGMPGPIQISKKDTERLRAGSTFMAGFSGVNTIFWSHFLACLFLPLTPRESIRPLVPLLIVNAVLMILFVIFSGSGWSSFFAGLGVIGVSLLLGLPGLGIVVWRQSSFKEAVTSRLMRGRYVEMHRELVDARRIHESLFPAPTCEGNISVRYAYEPMRQIGGDYLFCKHTLAPAGNQRLNMVMLDVTGHGIPAALTVNRLHGELERIFAEQPNTDPGQVLRLLNRYVNLTLAGHCVYVTGLCIRVDSVAESLEYASGGHPPAFLYAADCSLSELHSTAMILGAVPDAEFEPDMATCAFAPGDRLIAYTDGAFECRDRGGNQLRISGIRALIAKGPGTAAEWPAAIIKSVEQFRFGPPPDDTLVVELQHATGSQTGIRKEQKGEFFKSARSGIHRAIDG